MGCVVRGGTRAKDSEKQYGPWLRVPSPRRRRENNGPSPFDWQRKGREQDSRTPAGGNNFRQEGSRTVDSKQVFSDSERASFTQADGMVKSVLPVNMEPAPERDRGTVMEEDSSNGAGVDLGVISGTLMENLSVNGQRANITDMEWCGGVEQSVQERKMNLKSKECEDNLKRKEQTIKEYIKRKEQTINEHINGVDYEEEKLKRKEQTSKEHIKRKEQTTNVHLN